MSRLKAQPGTKSFTANCSIMFSFSLFPPHIAMLVNLRKRLTCTRTSSCTSLRNAVSRGYLHQSTRVSESRHTRLRSTVKTQSPQSKIVRDAHATGKHELLPHEETEAVALGVEQLRLVASAAPHADLHAT